MPMSPPSHDHPGAERRPGAASPPARSSEPVGEAVRELLELRGLTQRALATRMGVSPAMLSMVAAGRTHFTRQRLEQLADVLGVPPSHFREYRALLVAELLQRQPELVDELFDRMGEQPPASGD